MYCHEYLVQVHAFRVQLPYLVYPLMHAGSLEDVLVDAEGTLWAVTTLGGGVWSVPCCAVPSLVHGHQASSRAAQCYSAHLHTCTST
jgi:hypothetical protein